ncbi:MAG: DNA translocase FtsK 4TM domain-containing protein, partial [Desulfobacterales bacterium]
MARADVKKTARPSSPMRKEIIGIFLFFLVILTLTSLLSYSPDDPSIHNARAEGAIFNLFGLVGAHLAGLLVGLFGLGAFWLPVLLLFSSLHFFGSRPERTLTGLFMGGLLLVVTSGSLMALQQDHYELLGSRFSAGGIIGIPLKSFLVRYSNLTGGAIILALLWLVGFMMATGFSLLTFARRARQLWV